MSIGAGWAQATGPYDSLVRSLQAKKDTARVMALLGKARQLVYKQPGKAIAGTRLCLEASLALGFQKGVAISYTTLGVVNGIQTNYSKSLDYLLKSLRVYENLGDQRGIAKVLGYVANVYTEEGDSVNSVKFYKKAILMNEKIGTAHSFGIRNNLGLALIEFGHYEAAQRQFNRMLDEAVAHQKPIWEAKAYNQLGKNANAAGNTVAALAYYKQALVLNQKLGRKEAEAIAIANLGEVNKKLGKYRIALGYFKKSLALREEIDHHYRVAIASLKIAQTYLALGDHPSAVRYAQKSLAQAQQLKVGKFVAEALATLGEIYAQQNNYALAFAYQKRLLVLKDSLNNEEKTKALAKMRTQFNLERKEQEIALKNARISSLEANEKAEKILRYVLVAAGLLLLALVGFVFRQFKVKQKAASVLKVKNEEINSKSKEIVQANLAIKKINGELEKKMLRAQMDPHFIFNSLNSIQHFITINDKYAALTYLSKFSRLIRQVLENSTNQQVAVADEVNLLKYYVQLESMRFGHSFVCSFHVDDSLNIYEDQVPFLLIQPYVENAIVHGLIHLESRGQLDISLKKDEGYIVCVVEDNGIGRVRALAYKKNRHRQVSHGMPITAKRLELLNEGKANKTLVKVTDLYDNRQNASGTRVEILIPLNHI